MALRHLDFIDLSAHAKAGGFDHAAVHEPTGRVYVAHTANDAVDVIDIRQGRCVGSIPGLAGVAGAPHRRLVCALLPGSHRAAVHEDDA